MTDDPRPPDLPTRTEDEGETLDLPEGMRPFTPGQVSGQRFRILSPLGRGGMGEVWRAFDLKLRVEVALKALRPELLADPRRLELLREEVRVARQVTSPNVCRVYDLVEVECRELVSMEYVDGRTLLDELKERAPLDPAEAQALAAQFLSGLEAIHEAGLVHRDVKPENIMLTRTGRVVVMDFGIARSAAEGAGSVSGTPAYMAPEQARGAPADLRSDIFSVGVMLAEMVSPDGIRDFDSRQSVWEGLRKEPVEVPQSPWAGVIRKAVAKDPGDRFASTAELQRALEDLAFRVHDEQGLAPYPGLAAFDVSDREFFYGREAEVERVWTRLDSTHLLAVVGASGVGKSSFLGAGVIPARPEDWTVLRCTPGTDVMAALRRVVEDETGEEVANDDDALVAGFTSWRLNHREALLVVDQFEEVFTQNPAEAQRRVAALIGRLVLDADIHVLISLRDDFLLRCHEHAELAPVFSELTPLRTPVGGALRRAVVQPALRCGYRFEDEELADELLAEVEGERGALPLLAFALARLWNRRDRETGRLTRAAYREIGGVVGALAQHAEATIDRIGVERIAIVRELFRNLVTAEGTRAVREWDELLSVFCDSSYESPEEVLRQLIDARLLTSYEIREEDEAPTRRVEIIHESLLANWPRLVRWQTQDADAAQLRDQLRQAAKTWNEQGRSDDTLWTGAAYREFASWRERYPGGLTESEEAFATAMTAFATRRRRRRRIAAAAAFAVLIVVLAIVGTLWRRSVLETRRAEAQKLLALGQIELETDPTSALAWARASLQVADTAEGRLFALRALSKGPIARILTWDIELGQAHHANFSPDGEWVALQGYSKLKVFGRHGGRPVFVDDYPTAGFQTVDGQFDATSRHLYAYHRSGIARVYSVPDFSEVDQFPFDAPRQFFFQRDDVSFFVTQVAGMKTIETRRLGEQLVLLTRIPGSYQGGSDFDASGSTVVYAPMTQPTHVYQQSLVDSKLPPRLVAEHTESVRLLLDPQGRWVATQEKKGLTVRLWSLESDAPEELASFEVEQPLGRWQVDTAGNLMVQADLVDGSPLALVWDLRLPSGAEPMTLRSRKAPEYINGVSIDPSGRWVAAGGVNEIPFWSLPEESPVVFAGDGNIVYELDFASDGKALVVPRGFTRLESLPLVKDRQRTVLLEEPVMGVSASQGDGTILATANFPARVFVIRPGDPNPIVLEGFDDSVLIGSVAYEPERQLVAAGVHKGPAEHKVIRVWDLDDQTVQVLGPTDGAGENFIGGYWPGDLKFLDDGTLLTYARMDGIRRWNLEDGSSELLLAGECGGGISVGPDARYALVRCRGEDRTGRVVLFDLQTRDVTELPQYSARVGGISASTRGDVIAVGTVDGAILVGSPSTAEPHVLFGHDAAVYSVAFSPDGRFLASADQSGEIRVWPVPDVSKTPFQSLPYAELMAKLGAMTNLRAIRDEESSTGWKIEVGPFPGWAEVPGWETITSSDGSRTLVGKRSGHRRRHRESTGLHRRSREPALRPRGRAPGSDRHPDPDTPGSRGRPVSPRCPFDEAASTPGSLDHHRTRACASGRARTLRG